MSYQRVIWPERGVARIEAFELPEPSENEVLLRTRATLISPGTERAFFLSLPNTSDHYPQYPGYSNIGEIVHAGGQAISEAGVPLTPGMRVASMAGHASHAILNGTDCIAVPDNVSDEEATFFCIGAISLQAVRKTRLELGESVLVMGAGLIGLMAAQLAQAAGGLPVICVDTDAGRLEFARALGIDHALPADDKLPARIDELCGRAGAAVVIEATGHPLAIPSAFAHAARYGRVVLLGSTRGETDHVNFYRDVHQKGLTVLGAHNGTRPKHDSSPGWWTLSADMAVVLNLQAHGRLPVAPLITHRFHWSQALEGYRLLAEGDLKSLGMVLDWTSD